MFRLQMPAIIGTIQALSGWQRQGTALLAGALTALALPPVDFLPVCFFAFPVLVWLIDGIYDRRMATGAKPYRLAALTGWSFGFGYFVAGLWWIGNAMLIDIAAYGWTIPFAVLGLPAALAFFYALAVFIAFLLWQTGYGRLLALGLGFGVAEWLRGVLFTGFPWNAIGYTAMPYPLLMQAAAVIGLYGMNALAVVVYATPALLAGGKFRKTGFIITALLILADIGFGFYRLAPLPPVEIQNPNAIRVRLIQPSIPQNEKMDGATLFANFEKQLALTAAQPEHGALSPQLVIWPETAVPYLLNPEIRIQIGNTLQAGQLALVGSVRKEEGNSITGKPRYFNSIQVVNHKGWIIASADKVHLVPFGEYLPFSALFRNLGMQAIAEVAGGYSAAEKRTSIRLANGPVILPLICYEAIFPTELDYEGTAPDVLVNISNDAWFGNSPGPWQHFAQARIRAVEQGLPLLRATNNGISAIIDSYGRITTMIGHNKVGFTDAVLPEKIVPIWDKSPGARQAFFIFIILLLSSAAMILFRQSERIDNFR